MSTPEECDVLIVGGGLVGTVLANALAALPLRVLLVEARRVETLEQPSFDSRATALANGSRRILSRLGLWHAIEDQAQPIRHIHIGEQGRFGAARIDACEEGVEALGYTVENRVLGQAFWAPLTGHARFTCLAPAEVRATRVTADRVEARITADGEEYSVRSRLLVAADGARSGLRASLGIEAHTDDYGQRALIVNCATELPHQARAFERFTGHGPLAVLPLTRHRVAIVWTLPAERAENAGRLGDAAFRDALQRAFGYRLGRFGKVGVRAQHPLFRVRSESVARRRTVLIGNAAVALHPVAGQGFNLALRDAAALAEVVADALGDGVDFGAAATLARYRDWRRDDQRKLASFTHALVRGFGLNAPGFGAARGAGLVAFDLLPGAKSVLARHTMGLAGRVPKLARGLSIA